VGAFIIEFLSISESLNALGTQIS